ncbi:MAG TPA: hypothetical protein VNJ47_14120 [Nevskiales bacterium]|nr:hypothetical protein [Nevskiales bacterium]
MAAELLALTAATAGLLWYCHRRHRGAVKAERAVLFDACLACFETHELTQDDVGFPTLRGRYRGYTVRLELLAEHLGLRKLPCLWLRATVLADLPWQGVFDFLARPQGSEFFSPAAGLAQTLPIPEDWPQHALLRSDCAERMPPLTRLAPHMCLFEDWRAKELLVTPRGVRIVYLVQQADRGQYQLWRRLAFEHAVLPAALVDELLERALAIHADLRYDEKRR